MVRLKIKENDVIVTVGKLSLSGTLTIPENATGIVLFAHGSGSSRHSPRNRYVASELNAANQATLLLDLLTPEEDVIDMETREHRFNIKLLADRLVGATNWLLKNPETKGLKIGYFGASTGAAAALVAAAVKKDEISAVVSRGGRPDLAGPSLNLVTAPTLLIIGGNDYVVIDLNQEAFDLLKCSKRMEIVPGATHLFEEPGTLEEVANLAKQWFTRYL